MNKRHIIKAYQLVLLFCGLCLAGPLAAQKIKPADRVLLQKKEDSLKLISSNFVMAPQASERFRADSLFIRTFVRALKTPNSFYYPFDSVGISRLYAPDSSFRIFTWQLQKDEYVVMQKGAIQMRTSNGSLQLVPLHDVSMFTNKPLDSVRDNEHWIGAIYYRIVLKEFQGKKYYTLLGFDEFSVNSSKKWMDVLHFNDQGKPVFGGPLISFREDSVKRPVQARFSIEFKKEARAFFNYDPEMDMIIVDHLISESDEPQKKWTYVPDGDYEAFKWQNGQWVHVNKLFSQMQQDGDFPKEAMILDDAGVADEKKLEEASRRNMDREKKPVPTPKKEVTPKKPVRKNP